MSKKKYASGKNALSISDRSGFQFKYTEMVKEPGTRVWVHESESDGQYNLVDHPQNFPADTQEGIALENARANDDEGNPNFVYFEDNNFLVVQEQPVFES